MPTKFGITAQTVGVADLISDLNHLKDAGEESTWVVGTHIEYAVYLEFGTSRMPPYPFLRPAAEYVMSNQADAIADNAETVDQLVGRLALAIESRAKHYASTGVPPGPDVDTGTLRGSIRAKKVG